MTVKASKTTYLTTKTSNMTKKSKNRQKTLNNTNTIDYYYHKVEIQVKCSKTTKRRKRLKSSVMWTRNTVLPKGHRLVQVNMA